MQSKLKKHCFRGERKIWYGVSGLDGAHFDDVVKGLVPDLFEKQPDLLHHMTTTVNPAVLLHKVPCFSVSFDCMLGAVLYERHQNGTSMQRGFQ